MKKMQAKNDKDWQRKVCMMAGYICQVCKTNYNYDCYFQGEINQYVTGHHKKTKASHPEFRLTIENGLCVDIKCHNKIHNGEIKLNN